MVTPSFVPLGPYADSSLPTFPLAMYLNRSPLRTEHDIVFVRHLSIAMAQFAKAAAHNQGLEMLRKLVWWNLAPIAPFAVWAFIVQQLCRSIVKLSGKVPALLLSAKHCLTRESRLPMWQHNPAWDQFLSASDEDRNAEECISVLTVEYTFCLTAAIRIFEAFVKQDLAKDWQSGIVTDQHAQPSVAVGTPHQTLEGNHLEFGDPQATILNSPGIFIFEACASVMETSYALADRCPQAADKVQEVIANTLMVTGVLDKFPRRLQAVMDRLASMVKGECREGASQLRATAKEFCPVVREGHVRPGASVFSSAVHAPEFVPRVYSGARPLAPHIDAFEILYGPGYS